VGLKPASTVDMSDFSGMASAVDSRNLKPSQSPLMVNVMIIRQGELTVRRGLEPLVFDDDDA
jgi:hypothetical protein